MDDETPTEEILIQAPPRPQPATRPRWRRPLAIAAGVAMVPALYAVASAATGGGDSTPSTVAPARQSADDPGLETEIEHGVVVQKPHGGAATPSVPEATTLSVPDATTPTVPDATTPTVPDATTPTLPEFGDDHGGDRGAVTLVPSGTQTFSSPGGSIVVAVNGSSVSLVSTSPAVGFGAEVHDNRPDRVEVRFSNGDNEWRIRVELGAGGLVPEVTQHG